MTLLQLLQQKLALLKQLLILTSMKTLLQVCEEHLGIDVTPSDLIPDTVACADTITTLIRNVDKTFPLVSGTWTLYDILEHRKDWKRVTEPSPETLILSPTGMGGSSMIGHVGIFLKDGVIASNDSTTGKFMVNYTLDSWTKRYKKQGGLPIFLYKRVV